MQVYAVATKKSKIAFLMILILRQLATKAHLFYFVAIVADNYNIERKKNLSIVY